jgi:hypothetical protein
MMVPKEFVGERKAKIKSFKIPIKEVSLIHH